MRAYALALAEHREALNRLNVYPVPDGDTGTNMALTVRSVVDELEGGGAAATDVCDAIAHGSLMGARGNSGVILSQVLRALATDVRDLDGIDGRALAHALTAASAAADQAVMRPVEGTILTVVRDTATAARDADTDDVLATCEAALAASELSLERTPELLPVLAEAGVVDAGGAGFVLLVHAMLHILDGRALPAPDDGIAAAPSQRPDSHAEVSDLRYEVMFFLEADDDRIDGFKHVWAGLGDSIVVVGGDGLWNCHVHTDDIGAAIEAGIDVGRPRQIRVSDLAEEVLEERWVREGAVGGDAPAPREEVACAVVAVSPAAGIGRIFHSLGVQELVTGGQTMNPSTRDLIAAVEAAPADSVVVLPNNSNIVAVAEQVDGQTDKSVRVVATRSVPEGFASLLAYDPHADVQTNVAAMAELAGEVTVGEVTRAVRATSTGAGEVAAGDWIGLDSSGVSVIDESLPGAATGLLDRLVGDSHEIVTIIEGAGAGDAETRVITEWLAEHRPDVEAEVHKGGQDHYPYLFGVE